ncbi:MAG: hypothetical protein IKM24_01805 [Clostridia bacterium]|nr:hypothetical protein [Clostridia bacterium]
MMLKNEKRSVLQEIIIVLIGGLLMGMLWRARGEHGWGSESGVLMVGFVYTLFSMVILGNRKKMDLGWFAFTVSSFVLTTPAWGTLLSQITGTLRASATVDEEVLTADISVFSAVFMMLCLGFGMATLFGILLGRGYSDKQWKLRDIILLVAVFYAVDLITKASVAHWVIQAVQPEAAELFEQGLRKAGIEGSAYSVYMEHFASIPWGKKIHGGRNYFSEVQVVANAIKTLVCLLFVRFVIKDKTAAKIGFAVNGAFAISITVADLFFFFTNGGLRGSMEPYTGSFIYAWSNWEYFTGFIAGVIITAVLLKCRPTSDVADLAFANVPEKAKNIFIFLGGFGVIAVNMIRPAVLRFDTTDTSTVIGVMIGVILAVSALILFIRFAGINAEKCGMENLARVLLAFFVGFIAVFYLFICTEEYRNILEINTLHNILFSVSAVLCLAWSIKEAVKIKQIQQ